MFAPFGEARHKITSGDTSHSRDMYFGIYQALSPAGNEVFRQYRPDFFDLVIVDECHRGSSRADSDLQDEAAAEPRKFYVDGGHVESFEHLAAQGKSPEDRRTLQQESLFGQEANPLPYMLAPMNLLLHGLEAPLIAYGNTLAQKLTDIGDRDRVDLILTNPPFGGEEEAGIKANFPADRQTAETALLFLQCIMRKLRRPGRGSKEGGRPARRNCRPG
jgi:hypothetical protein